MLRLEAHLDDVGPAAQGLQDVLDRVGQGGRRLADGGQPLGLRGRLLVELGVLDRQPGLQADRGEQAELVGGVGVVA